MCVYYTAPFMIKLINVDSRAIDSIYIEAHCEIFLVKHSKLQLDIFLRICKYDCKVAWDTISFIT